MLDKYIDREKMWLPVSANRYYILQTGELFHRDNSPVETYVNQAGMAVAYIEYFDGLKEYSVGLLIALAFKPLKLVYTLWNKLDVMYVDGSSNNVHPSNVLWKFPEGGLPYIHNSEYRYIPGFTEYVIDSEDTIMSTMTRRFMSPSNSLGYALVTITSDIGIRGTQRVHRLKLYAEADYSADITKLHVNHLNGVKSDNRRCNLEWCTAGENRRHAHQLGLDRDDTAILVKDIMSTTIMEFVGYTAVAKAFSITRAAAESRVASRGQKCYKPGLQYKRKDDAVEWLVVPPGVDNLRRQGITLGIFARNVFTNEINEFKSIYECATTLGFTLSGVRSQLSGNRKLIRAYRGYDFKYIDDPSPWPHYSEIEFQTFRANPLGKASAIKLTNVSTLETFIFPDRRAAAAFLGTYPNHVTNRLCDGGLIMRKYKVTFAGNHCK